jgi:signal transduction histidine kinase
VLRQAVDYYDLQEERRRLILELEKANADLRHANDLKRAFIRVASHELRTPLTIVMGLSELAVATPEVKPPMDEWMRQVHKASTRLNERVDQVIKMLLAERFERPLQPAEVALEKLLRGAANEVSSFVQQRRQELQVDIPEGLGTVFVEPDKLHDSIVQLLVNAIKFTPDGGRIRLSARRTASGGTEIAVSDTGVGIDLASRERIFDPFFTRFDVSRHSSGDFEFGRRGLGLGLSMVKLFVEMHGGSVKVHSQVGQGTTFTIELPGRTLAEQAGNTKS